MEIAPPRSFPFCIVWTPIPIITWLMPFIGHMGICRSDGTILDFMGPYTVEVGNFGFGHPTRYLRLNPELCSIYNPSNDVPVDLWWNEALDHAAEFFRTLFYNLCGTNCHSFVAFYLNQVAYKNFMRWNTLNLAVVMFFTAKYIDFWSIVKTWLPSAIIITLASIFGKFYFLYTYASMLLLTIFYFFIYEYIYQAQSRLFSSASGQHAHLPKRF